MGHDDDPNKTTKGLLDEEHLREDAADVDRAIQDAKNRNPETDHETWGELESEKLDNGDENDETPP